MTVKKATKCRGQAILLTRQQVPTTSKQVDLKNIKLSSQTPSYNIVVSFNEKDQLELRPESDGDKTSGEEKQTKNSKLDAEKIKKQIETYNLEEIANCVTADVTHLVNTLVFYIVKHHIENEFEAIVLQFEIEQDYKRIFFTYKYFKMRNRLTTTNLSSYASSENLHTGGRKGSFDINKKTNSDLGSMDPKLAKSEYDLMQRTDNDGVTYISVQQKYQPRSEQPSSLVTIKSVSSNNLEELDSMLFVDTDVPVRPQRRKRFLSKFKYQAPQLPENPDSQNKSILKGQMVRINVSIDGQNAASDGKVQKSNETNATRDSGKTLWSQPSSVVWQNRVVGGYESDREEWRTSRSTFSTSAFDSLSRPTRMALAFTLRKPAPNRELNQQYYRISNDKSLHSKHVNGKMYTHPSRLPVSTYVDRSSLWSVPRIPRSIQPENLKKTGDYRKISPLPQLENFTGRRVIADHNNNAKKQSDSKKPNVISSKLTGFTNKLKELSNMGNGQNAKSKMSDNTNLKPVIKKNTPKDGGKRAIVRTCIVEPPKKVTFSAFATVQVV